MFKPWGLTLYGQRKLEDRRAVQWQPDKVIPSPLVINAFLGFVGVLVVVFSYYTSLFTVFTTVTEPEVKQERTTRRLRRKPCFAGALNLLLLELPQRKTPPPRANKIGSREV